MSVPPLPSDAGGTPAEELNPRAPKGSRKGLAPLGSVHIEHEEHHELSFVKKYIFSTDHKMIGLQFLFTGLLLLGVCGALALSLIHI